MYVCVDVCVCVYVCMYVLPLGHGVQGAELRGIPKLPMMHVLALPRLGGKGEKEENSKSPRPVPSTVVLSLPGSSFFSSFFPQQTAESRRKNMGEGGGEEKKKSTLSRATYHVRRTTPSPALPSLTQPCHPTCLRTHRGLGSVPRSQPHAQQPRVAPRKSR
ncbi:hypothetical protein K505DRAFT_137298 [Melanomma pulvis-pyrius CBS 109.77]|uniref:Uncharacterized protein n=1 Tax=Melanomma pulvis-pyrius CBS 109.77 TaxID=1314802 RepID=A0A6A6WRX4_9PLEO|nr:hypothetical protein K505DRAFT_137298 [Melanomma pulvis-pyrius CBS 109.77]